MAVVKVKDANGNWQSVVAVKGDKGDTGPAGPSGTTSFNGLSDVPSRVKNAVSSVNGISPNSSGSLQLFSAGTSDLTAGSSSLATNTLYFVYE